MARTTLFTLSLLVASAFARTVKYNFNVANGQVAPDGVTRNAVLGMSARMVLARSHLIPRSERSVPWSSHHGEQG